jgi:hypothetical protein
MSGLPRFLIVYAIAIPLALVLGYLLSTGLSSPEDQRSLLMVGLVVCVLMLPIFLKWHHILLIFFWNSAFNVPFLPSQPHFWLILAVMSFGISWLNGLLGGGKFLRVPELTRPLVFLGLVTLATALARGGIGAAAFGSSSYGGKSYYYIFGAIIGYFAFTAVRIPLANANRAARIYFLSGLTFALANLAFMLGPAFYFLFYLLPGEFVVGQAATESGMLSGGIERLNGVSPACTALVCYFLVRWGIRGIFSYAHPWRFIILVLTFLSSLLGGFRSAVIIVGLLFLCQFFVEGLWRTRFLPILVGIVALTGVLLVVFSDQLPLVAQRAMSFLPVRVDPSVKADADNSTEWRIEIWRVLVPQIPKYFWFGKGYKIDPEELWLSDLAAARGEGSTADTALLAGDYHSGPLSTIIPLGIWGLIGLLWLLAAGTRVLYLNHRYGDPALYPINAFFLAYFIIQSLFFFAVFGAFNSQLCMFAGLLGMSVSINGGVCRPGRVPALAARQEAAIAAPVPVEV